MTITFTFRPDALSHISLTEQFHIALEAELERQGYPSDIDSEVIRMIDYRSWERILSPVGDEDAISVRGGTEPCAAEYTAAWEI